jgi:hypothetical protein
MGCRLQNASVQILFIFFSAESAKDKKREKALLPTGVSESVIQIVLARKLF